MSDVCNKEAMKHLRVIAQFHKEAMVYKCPVNKNIKNNLGKTIEGYKVDIKKIEKYLQSHTELLSVENKLFLVRAKNSVNIAEKSNYIELIKRSMARSEICIGNNIPLNLGNANEMLVINIEDCYYDLIEMDGINYLSKLKRKATELDFEKLIHIYCVEECLGVDSENFMLALLSYPREFFKCFERYILNKRQWTTKEFKKNIDKAFEKDGDSLI